VVVCSRDRTESLAECLAALSGLDYPDHEVLVVDNAPDTDATERLVAEMPGVRYVREDRPGLDWARNRGLSEARHGIIAYTDDDTRADRCWLRGFARAFADPRVAAATGLVTPMELDGEAQNYFEFNYGGMGKGFLTKRWSLGDMGPRRILWSSGCGVGANMAFRRDALESLGGFDPALDVGTATRGGGDIEIIHRLLASDFVLRYEPSALVWHRHRTDWAGLAGQLQDNGSGFGAYLLTAWKRRTVPRRHIFTFALRDWILGWQLRRLLRPRAHRRALVWREITGMLGAPVRLRKATAAAAALSPNAPPAFRTSAQPRAEPSQ
jgi:glycosyltransferase involved in cell wall biosynthesis